MIQFKKMRDDAIVPTLATEGSVGFDLYAAEDGIVSSDIVSIIPVGVAVKIPEGYGAFIEPRSGFAAKYGVDTLAGVIDRDFRGEIQVILTSHWRTLAIEKGDRIAQLVVKAVDTHYEVVEELDETERGNKGFGSTGV